jgi:hypothetical protein
MTVGADVSIVLKVRSTGSVLYSRVPRFEIHSRQHTAMGKTSPSGLQKIIASKFSLVNSLNDRARTIRVIPWEHPHAWGSCCRVDVRHKRLHPWCSALNFQELSLVRSCIEIYVSAGWRI